MPLNVCKAFIDKALLQRASATALAAALAACSGMPQPTEQVDSARAAVAQAGPVAQSDGAAELQLARTKLAGAEEAMQRGDYVLARVLAEQAEVDARYAWTAAESERFQRALNRRTQ